MKSKIREFFFKNKEKLWELYQFVIVFITVLLMIFGLVFLLKYLSSIGFFQVIGMTLKNILGNEVYNIILISFLFSTLVTLLIASVIFFALALFDRLNKWVFWTIVVMIFILFSGIFIIDGIAGSSNLSLHLRDGEYAIYGNITCGDSHFSYTAGEKVVCTINPPLQTSLVQVYFDFKDGTRKEETIEDLSFLAPPDLRYISFHIEGNDENGSFKELDTGWPYTFKEQSTKEEDEKRAISYLAILLGIIFFSVPHMALNFKKLSEKHK